LSRRSQFLLWLLQHQPEVIEVVIEYETDADGDDIMSLEENHALAEAMCDDLMDGDKDVELEAQRNYLQALYDFAEYSAEADRESGADSGSAQQP
ncbi:MAG: hypothetical protein EBZ22_05935, partial [Flavobacteriia bacterium]|nr:hypothetical protein [Flavobacteriia bacterium]